MTALSLTPLSAVNSYFYLLPFTSLRTDVCCCNIAMGSYPSIQCRIVYLPAYRRGRTQPQDSGFRYSSTAVYLQASWSKMSRTVRAPWSQSLLGSFFLCVTFETQSLVKTYVIPNNYIWTAKHKIFHDRLKELFYVQQNTPHGSERTWFQGRFQNRSFSGWHNH